MVLSARTVPLMQHDEHKIEDINTDMEDHAADEWRYACMSRPYIRLVPSSEPAKWPTQQSVDEILAAHIRKKRQE